MASDYRLISATGTTLYLVNSSGAPTLNGAATAAATTPFAVRADWTPQAAEDGASYVDETIPLVYYGSVTDTALDRLQAVRRQFTAMFDGPCALYVKPNGATNEVYYHIYTAEPAQEAAFEGTKRQPGEGAATFFVDIPIRRSPFGGSAALASLLTAQSFTNTHTGDLVSLGTLTGDRIYCGQPLNVQFDKPTSQAAATVYLATVYSRTADTTTSTVTTTNQTVGSAFTASGSIDVSALRTRAGLKTRVIGRLTTLTAPSKIELQATIKTAGNAIWSSPWLAIGTNTTAQLVDFGYASLTQLRYPLSNTSNITVTITIRSSDGTSVTATLGYVEVLLYYDFSVVTSAGLAASQRYQLLGAQNLGGAGYQPMIPEAAWIATTSDAPIAPAQMHGPLIRAYSGASLYAAWRESDGGHTNTDTTTITVKHLPLWQSLRGLS